MRAAPLPVPARASSPSAPDGRTARAVGIRRFPHDPRMPAARAPGAACSLNGRSDLLAGIGELC